MHSASMLHSALVAVGASLSIHYLHDPSFPEAHLRRLEAMCTAYGATILFHEVLPDRLEGLPIENRFGRAMWYRAFLPDLLPEVDRVLYLDVDALIVDAIDPLFSIDLGQRYLAAVPNVFMEYHRNRLADLGMTQREYFNSGVLLLNLETMRACAFSQRLVELVRSESERLAWPDQDALNLLAKGNWMALDPRWNSMNSFRSRPCLAEEVFGAAMLSEAIERPAIRHFEGPGSNKPWHILHSREGQKLYRSHREATPWPTYLLEGRSATNRVKRLLADACPWGGRDVLRRVG